MNDPQPGAKPRPHYAPLDKKPDGFNLGSLLGLLLRRAHIVVLGIILGVVLGYYVQAHLVPRYTSTVSILLDPKRPGALGAEGQFANAFADSNKVAGVVAILESPALLARVVKDEGLANVPDFGDAKPSPLAHLMASAHLAPDNAPTAVDNSPETREARAVYALSRAIRINRGGLAYLIGIDVTNTNPEMAQRLAASIAKAYMDDELETKFDAAKRDGQWVADRLNELRSELQRSEVALEAVRQKYGLSQIGVGGTVDQQLIASLNTQLVQAQADASASRTRYEQALHLVNSGGKLDGLPEVQASMVIVALRAQEADVNRRIADLTARYTSKYPDVGRAQDDRRTIQAQISGEISRIVDNLHNQYQAAEERQHAVEAQLSKVMAGQAGGAGPQGHLELQDAERVVEANRALYNSYLARSRDIQQQQTRQEVEARIIAPAFVPDAPSFPKPIMFIGAGGAIGLLFGVGLALLGPMLHRGFSNIADLEHFTLLPVLGTIPMLSRRELAAGGRRLDIVEYANSKQLSLFAESLRILRASLRVSAGMAPRVIQITSAVPGEGKSTMSAALAMSAAAAGIRTVLVDADLRHSSVSRLFGMQEHEGIVDVVHGTRQLDTVLQPYRELPLRIMGAGSLDLPRPDVINSERFRSIIQSLAKSCELVIVDSPPILAVADALVISDLADTTLLVVEWRNTRKDFVKQALKVLRNAHAQVAGISLNKVDFSRLRTYDRGYHGFGTYAQGAKKYYLN